MVCVYHLNNSGKHTGARQSGHGKSTDALCRDLWKNVGMKREEEPKLPRERQLPRRVRREMCRVGVW